MKHRIENYDNKSITPETLDELREKLLLIEDALIVESGRRFEETGRLNDPQLSEMSVEYENLCMDIEALEEKLRGKDCE